MKARVMAGLVMCAVAFGGRLFFTDFTQQKFPFVLSASSSLSNLSPDQYRVIQSFLAEQTTRIADSHLCGQELLHRFSALKTVTMNYKQGKCIVRLKTARPVALFNDQLVLTDRDTLIPCAVWKEELLQELPRITVADMRAVTKQHQLFLKQLARTVQGKYTVEWNDELLIKFHDQKNPRITLLGSSLTDPQVLLHPFCDDLKKKIKEEKMRGTVQRDWCIDMRFKNQMVVYMGVGK